DVINEIGESVANDPYFGEMIIETPKVLRLDSFDDSAITIKVLGVCKPMTQWEIKGEMNRRIKKRFDEEGIEIPFPHQTIYWGYGAHPQRGNQGTEWVEPGGSLRKRSRSRILRACRRRSDLSGLREASRWRFLPAGARVGAMEMAFPGVAD
ncbi:MAG: mechanosensitive ion channel family protein, partial [Chloroflexi bacterium]|nr:mechanosensitive ion channel family protein [Chloroflexota bacterium]